MGKKEKKKLSTIIGFILLVLGITGGIPSFLAKSYFGLATAAIFVIAGVLLLAWGMD